jgi:hypothetical protein
MLSSFWAGISLRLLALDASDLVSTSGTTPGVQFDPYRRGRRGAPRLCGGHARKTKPMTPPPLRQVEAVGWSAAAGLWLGTSSWAAAHWRSGQLLFYFFFSSIFSIFLFYNSILEFNYGLDDLDHMNILKLILGCYLGCIMYY